MAAALSCSLSQSNAGSPLWRCGQTMRIAQLGVMTGGSNRSISLVFIILAGPSDLHIAALIFAGVGVGAGAFTHGHRSDLIITVANKYNAIGALLDGEAELQPCHRRKANGEVDARDWCEGFMAAVNQSREAWEDVLDPMNHLNGLMLPVMIHCVDAQGRPLLGPSRKGPEPKRS